MCQPGVGEQQAPSGVQGLKPPGSGPWGEVGGSPSRGPQAGAGLPACHWSVTRDKSTHDSLAARRALRKHPFTPTPRHRASPSAQSHRPLPGHPRLFLRTVLPAEGLGGVPGTHWAPLAVARSGLCQRPSLRSRDIEAGASLGGSKWTCCTHLCTGVRVSRSSRFSCVGARTGCGSYGRCVFTLAEVAGRFQVPLNIPRPSQQLVCSA